MHFIQAFFNVGAFFPIGDELYYFTKNGDLVKLENNLTKAWNIKLDMQWNLFNYNSELLYSYSQYEKIAFIDKSSGETYIDNVPFRPIEMSGIKLYGAFLDIGNEKTRFSFGSVTFKGYVEVLIETGEEAPIKYFDDCIICQYGKAIISCWKTDKKVWTIDFAALMQGNSVSIFGEVICFNKKLFVFVSDVGNASSTFIIDIDTGKIEHQTEKFGGWLQLNNSYVYAVSAYSIRTLNTNTFEVTTKDLSENLKSKGIAMEWNTYAIKNNTLYYTDTHRPAIGTIGLENNTLSSYSIIKVDNPNLQKVLSLKVVDNRVYALTSDDTLHIFTI